MMAEVEPEGSGNGAWLKIPLRMGRDRDPGIKKDYLP